MLDCNALEFKSNFANEVSVRIKLIVPFHSEILKGQNIVIIREHYATKSTLFIIYSGKINLKTR